MWTVWTFFAYPFLEIFRLREVMKNGYFTVRLTVNKRENLIHFFIEMWFFDTQNTFHLIVKALKNAFFMPYLWLQMITQRGWPLANNHLVGGWIAFSLCKIRFRTHIFIVGDLNHNPKKIRKSWPLVGGWGWGDQRLRPDRKISVFYDFPWDKDRKKP